ncbi:MAG TPA: adenylate/guanylate cyclase domain-containing protein [Flavobacterium sp.]|uniref:adenylate/guanylate cyclase domain-containing protein n=1 Tax=Flavobacterium sp. TaxID=239 RepID=UPI002DB8CD39|nr:adenylate/guanylate cyclase domain-containing protein [Flavobacterium sp.]HEU4791549.1 adenylate/guanylate cyclase domain-containing protein [Flavobacterium sp.]
MYQTRQLAAIMFADIVGYTAIMGNDEQKAFEILNKNRELQKPIIEQFNGRWIKELGDGVMASFNTVSDAVYAAQKIQNLCNVANDFQLRIGIHLGDVLFENDDIFGDGVNIASRIQEIAQPGSIYISESVQQNVSNKKDIQTKFIKEEKLKNVKDPLKIYEVIIMSQFGIIPEKGKEIIAKNSIAVLPFVNMSNDPEQEYFCDGISEEIINALAQLCNLRVIARTSVFSFKEKNIDVREIGKLLEVDTLLEGSVRKSGNQLRITTKLIRVSDGSHIWSERYDRVLEDIFSIQENIAENVATALKGFLTTTEKELIRRPETIIEAYEYFLKGHQFFLQLNLSEAKKLFERAIELDSEYAPAYAGLADVYSWLYDWEGGNNNDLEEAERNSQIALSLAPNLSESHTSHGFVLSLGKRYDEAEQEFKEAIALNPNSYDAYYHYARTCFARGQIQQSADFFLKAAEARREDFQSMLLLSQSLTILGNDKAHEAGMEGIRRARKQLELNPNEKRALSLTAGHLLSVGQREEAYEWMNKALDLYPDDAGVLLNGTCLFAKDGDKERAMNLLEIASEKGYGKKDWIQYDPDYDSIREEPRFQILLSKLK